MTTAYTSWVYGFAAIIAVAVGIAVPALVRTRAAILPAIACAATALWALSVAVMPASAFAAWPAVFETLRTTSWLLLLIGLGRSIGGGQVSRTEKRFLVIGLALALLAIAPILLPPAVTTQWPVLSLLSIPARVGLLLLLVLVAENLYRNADAAARWHVNLPCIVLGGLSAFDVVLYAEASLAHGDSTSLLDARAALTALALPLLGIGTMRARRLRRQPGISRQFAFHCASLLIAGAFLVVVGIAGETIRRTGTEWSEAAQIALMGAALMALLVAMTSQSARSRIRWFVMDHFFAARFDYRHEWLRTVSILAGEEGAAPEPVRAIRAIADAVDSPAGVLLRREVGEDDLRWAGSWNCPAVPVTVMGGNPWLQGFGDGGWVQVLDSDAPAELRDAFGPLWLAVPLPHHRDGMVGVVLLAPPRAAFRLDREAFDLLRMLGREVALVLAERRSAERLVEQRRVEEYAKRFAFVAHDIKNVANQLKLVLANADRNIGNPAFQRDMLFTLRGSAERIDTLIARLRGPDQDAAPASPQGTGVPLIPRLRALARLHRHPVRIEMDGGDPGLVAFDPENFDAAIGHLVNNAVEASIDDEPVRIRIRRGECTAIIDIVDRGGGMTPEFIRDELFRPLSTSKPAGSGIGAWQARQLVQASGGGITVMSSPGAGTTIRLTLPVLAQPGGAAPAKEPAQA